jgi:ABC-type polysaccharide/polyol phosphate transport system ATPase subunit
MSEIIKIQNLKKRYIKNNKSGLKEFFVKKKVIKHNKLNREFAIDGISLSMIRGDSLAILGHNGSGKSTTLSILSGVMDKTSGEVFIDGSVSSLLELHSGINIELTGLQNIYLYSSILKVPLNIIKKNIDNIIAFSELGDSIHEIVRTYSSGMVARLAFSIIITVKSDILLIDEVFAVGDASFKKKCSDYITGFLMNGGTLVMVTHDLETAKKFCKRAIVLKSGKVDFDGPIDALIVDGLMNEKFTYSHL